jgi:hypothetical protein
VDTPLVQGMRAAGEETAAEVMKEVDGKLLTTRQVRQCCQQGGGGVQLVGVL